jgi:hypothetical protein
MWNSSIIAPSLLLWLVTALFGSVVAYNTLVTLAVAASAWLASIAARIFVSSRTARVRRRPDLRLQPRHDGAGDHPNLLCQAACLKQAAMVDSSCHIRR